MEDCDLVFADESVKFFHNTIEVIHDIIACVIGVAGIETDTAIALIIGATATPVLSRLPMEFLVESKQLIQMALSKD
jgi:hypothetical protein